MVAVVDSKKTFDALLEETPNACVHFAADWCDPSKLLHNEMNEWKYEKCRLVTAMVEEMPDVAEREGVSTVPFIVFYKDGKKVDTVSGAKVAEIKEKIEKLYAEAPKIDSEARMKALINRSKVMLFMKGCPEAPRCGFSRQIVDLLADTKVSYDTFDILSDDVIRQGLKVYSNWPTFPQLYVNGELLGGLDIVKELKENDELIDSLQ